MYCKSCGKAVAAGTSVCPFCGRRANEMSGGTGFWDMADGGHAKTGNTGNAAAGTSQSPAKPAEDSRKLLAELHTTEKRIKADIKKGRLQSFIVLAAAIVVFIIAVAIVLANRNTPEEAAKTVGGTSTEIGTGLRPGTPGTTETVPAETEPGVDDGNGDNSASGIDPADIAYLKTQVETLSGKVDELSGKVESIRSSDDGSVSLNSLQGMLDGLKTDIQEIKDALPQEETQQGTWEPTETPTEYPLPSDGAQGSDDTGTDQGEAGGQNFPGL